MTLHEIQNLEVPFKVRSVHNRRSIVTVTGFSRSDPTDDGVGRMFGLETPTAYFKEGGWLLVADLLKHYDLVRDEDRKPGRPRKAKK